jgi:hypothetical protein
MSEYSDTPIESLRQQVFKLLNKNHELKPKELCKLMDLEYKQYHDTITQYRKQWKKEYKNRQALKCLSFHNTRGWIYALKMLDRQVAVEAKGSVWLQTRAKNKMLLFKDRELGRLEWHVTGRINIWIKKPATWGRVKQLLAKAFTWTGLIDDIQIFDLWAASARFKGSHLVYDTGERLPYARIDYLKEALGVVVKTGDITHPTSLEIEFHYPDFSERNERLLEQVSKALELNSQQIQQFSGFLKDLSLGKPQKPEDLSKLPDFYSR